MRSESVDWKALLGCVEGVRSTPFLGEHLAGHVTSYFYLSRRPLLGPSDALSSELEVSTNNYRI